MAGENVEIVRSLYDATMGGRLDFNFDALAPDVELHLSGAFPDLASVYYGHDGARKLNEQLNAPWEDIALEPEEVIDLGPRVLVLSRFHARGRDGIEVRLPFAHLWTVEDGLVVRMDAFSDQEAAREAAGLSRRPPE